MHFGLFYTQKRYEKLSVTRSNRPSGGQSEAGYGILGDHFWQEIAELNVPVGAENGQVGVNRFSLLVFDVFGEVLDVLRVVSPPVSHGWMVGELISDSSRDCYAGGDPSFGSPFTRDRCDEALGWNPYSAAVVCGMLLTLPVGGVTALVGVAAGLYLCARWFGRGGRS